MLHRFCLLLNHVENIDRIFAVLCSGLVDAVWSSVSCTTMLLPFLAVSGYSGKSDVRKPHFSVWAPKFQLGPPAMSAGPSHADASEYSIRYLPATSNCRQLFCTDVVIWSYTAVPAAFRLPFLCIWPGICFFCFCLPQVGVLSKRLYGLSCFLGMEASFQWRI